jgi:hypothetical protein
MLAVCLRELALDHAIFEEMAFTDEAMDELACFPWLSAISENAWTLQGN